MYSDFCEVYSSFVLRCPDSSRGYVILKSIMMTVGGGGVCGGDGDDFAGLRGRQTEVVLCLAWGLILRSVGSLTCRNHGSRQSGFCENPTDLLEMQQVQFPW